MNAIENNQRRVFLVLALAVAGIGGFALAKLTSQSPAELAVPRFDATDVAAKPDKLDVEASHLAAVGIETQIVAAGNLSAEVRAPAVVAPSPDGEAIVTARATGAVVQINKRLGDEVEPGQVLARVESREAAAIAADRDVAISKAALAHSVMRREQGLFDQHVTPRQDLEAARAQLIAAESEERRARAAAADAHVANDGRSIEIVSPLAGRITAMAATLGSYVQPETELYRIADPSHVQIQAAVTATDALRIHAGDSAVVTSGSRGQMQATVRSVTAAVSEQTRSATVILSLQDSEKGGPTPGETVQVVMTPRAASTAGFVVPEDAIQRIDNRDVVFIRTQTGFRLQPVVVNSRSGGRASVVSGLNSGDTIATRNAFFLKAEMGKGAEGEEE